MPNKKFEPKKNGAFSTPNKLHNNLSPSPTQTIGSTSSLGTSINSESLPVIVDSLPIPTNNGVLNHNNNNDLIEKYHINGHPSLTNQQNSLFNIVISPEKCQVRL